MTWQTEEVRRRERLLTTALNLQDKGPGGGRLIGKSYEEIAQSLRQAFPGKKISARSARRFIDELRAGGAVLTTRPAHRPVGSRSSRSRDHRPLAAIWYEMQTLSGLNRSTLFEVLSQSESVAQIKRSTFMARLSALDPDWRAADRLRERAEQEVVMPPDWLPIKHVLRLHQIVLDGPSDDVWVVLLAYDTKTRYVNTQFVIADRPQVPSPRRRGRPVKHYSDALPPLVMQRPDGRCEVQFRPEWIQAFAEDTRQRLRLVTSGLMLNTSLGDTESLLAGLQRLVPSMVCGVIPATPQRVSPGVAREWSVESFRTKLAETINRHNTLVARPAIEQERQYLDELRSKAQHRISTADYLYAHLEFLIDRSRSAFAKLEKQAQDIALGRFLCENDRVAPFNPRIGLELTCGPIRCRLPGD